MTEDIDDGGPAFPEHSFLKVGEIAQGEAKPGMSLRDYFAAAAMQGLLASPRLPADSKSSQGVETDLVAKHAFNMADRMLAARKAGKP